MRSRAAQKSKNMVKAMHHASLGLPASVQATRWLGKVRENECTYFDFDWDYCSGWGCCSGWVVMILSYYICASLPSTI